MRAALVFALPALALVAAAAAPGSPLAAVEWASVASEVGLDFQMAGEIHQEDVAWPGFPEIIGGGACWADFDNDGYDDLYLVNQRYNGHNPAAGDWVNDTDPVNELYFNEGNGTLREAAEQAGVDSRAFGYGCSAADFDGDACVDLFVANFGDNELFKGRCDGTFANVTAESGVAMSDACGDFPCWHTSSAWGDYDLDGDLDLYVGTFVESSLQDNNRGPQGHVAQPNRLFRNDGPDATGAWKFAEVAEEAGVAGNPTDRLGTKTWGVVWFDPDLDGDLDLFVANDGTPDHLFVNLLQELGQPIFRDKASDAGVADPRSGMGVAAGDYDNDGYPDLYFTHYEFEHNGFYRNRFGELGHLAFEDRSGEDDLANDWRDVGWGVAFWDYDRDMDLDLLVANGHTEWIAANYNQAMRVFRNDPPGVGAAPGNRTWVDVSAESGAGIAEKKVTRGLAAADFDLDGDVDLVRVNNANQTAQFLRGSGVANRWLYVQLRDTAPGSRNLYGVGARVVLEAGGVAQERRVEAGSSFLSQHTLNLEFGLGQLAQADRVTVHWPAPNPGTTVVTGLAANQVVRIHRDGTVVTDTLAPRTSAVLQGVAGNAGWWRSPVEATLSAVDRGVGSVSGVVGTEARIGDGAWQPYGGQVFPFGEGRHALWMRSRDGAGNQEPPRKQAIDVDLTPPTASHAIQGRLGQNGWWTSPEVTVSLDATDALSGVAGIRYRVDGNAWQPYVAPFVIAGDGVHSLAFTAVDVAGNEAPVTLVDVRIDATPPKVLLASPRPGSAWLGPQELAALGQGPALVLATPSLEGVGGGVLPVAAEASDAASGVGAVRFLVNGSMAAERAAPPYSFGWHAGARPSGLYELRAVAVDVAGNAAQDLVAVLLASATPEGAAATLQEGPSVHPPSSKAAPPLLPGDAALAAPAPRTRP